MRPTLHGMRHTFARALAVGALVNAAALEAQPGVKPVNRFRVSDAADSNDAEQYFNYGSANIIKDPEGSNRAFYLAARINPFWADPIYAMRLSWFWKDPRRRFNDYNKGAKSLEKDGTRKWLDSLYEVAWLRDPFMSARLDAIFDSRFRPMIRRLTGKPEVDGGIHLFDGSYREALVEFGKAIARDSARIGNYLGRAHAFFYLEQYDSAAHQIGRAIDKLAQRDDSAVVAFYRPKAWLEYARGHALLMGRFYEPAREAYGRALAEDLAFYMAHVRLAAIAAFVGDTTTAIQEYDLAIELQGADPTVRYEYGSMLLVIGKYDEATVQFNKAAELEPNFAAPYLSLGIIEQASGNTEQAKTRYEQFLARSVRDDPAVVRVTKWLAAHAAAARNP